MLTGYPPDKLYPVIVRERGESFVLVEQHDHALASAQFARHWGRPPRPLESTLYAIAQHDVAWQGPDSSVRWNEEAGRPYSFTDYPPDEKVRAYVRGLDRVEEADTYAACLCSMHYATLMRRFGGSEAERRFAQDEERRQERLRAEIPAEGLENLDRNLSLLRLCDGLSLYVCLRDPGEEGYPPPYPEGFVFAGESYEPVWEDARTLRLEPNPFSAPFGVQIPYRAVGRDRRSLGGGLLEFGVVTS
jgi:hypothetical protein